MRLLLTAFSVVSVLATAPSDLKADEAQLKDVIEGVVGRYLGHSNESQVLSSALMKAFEDEGFGDEVNNIKASTASPESSTVSLEKRDIRADALPPPELFLDLLGEDLDNPRKPSLHMEIAANAKRNCTKRKRRKKKSKTEPFKLPVGLTRTNQRDLAEYSTSGVPPPHVEIPRLANGDHQYFDDETSQRPIPSAAVQSSFAHLPDLKQRNQDKVAAYSEHAPTSYQVPSTYFSLGSTIKPSVRRNPFERFEQTTSFPFREDSPPETRDALVPKRAKNRDFRTTTPIPSNKFANDESDVYFPSFTNRPTSSRPPKVRPTTLAPLSELLQQPEVAQYSFPPKSATTLRPLTSRPASRPTTTSNSYSSRGQDASYRTLVPSSLNKGTLQHFSLYPKQPQSNSFSKIILAVGGARYAPLPMNFTTSLNSGFQSNVTSSVGRDSGSGPGFGSVPDYSDRAASPTGFYNTVVAKQTSSLAAHDESLVIQTPTVRLIPKYPENTQETPSSLLPISPKVVSGQVLVFSSGNQPEDVESGRGDEVGRSDPDDLEKLPIGTTTSAPQQTTDCVTHGETTTTRPEFGARMFPPSSLERRTTTTTTTSTPSQSAVAVTTDKPGETSSNQGFMPDAPTILMQVPLPDYPELSNHGYVKGNAQLHIPLVYKLQKKKDKVNAQRELTKERTLISLPNNPFARLNPVNTAYYKYRESDIKGYLPKAFIRLERVQNVQLNAQAPQRSMVVFE